MVNLTGKVALVTGAAHGIGRGIALNLAKLGAQVIVSDINLADAKIVSHEIKAMGASAIAIKCDVSLKHEVDTLFKRALKHFAKLDILIHNAGIYPYKKFAELNEADWDKVMAVNLKSAFFCSQAASKVMKPNSKIVHISSMAAFIGYPGFSHYCASKAGMNGFVRALALELATSKINVNALAPGIIDNTGEIIKSSKKEQKSSSNLIPLGRVGTPADIAEVASFLASDCASYITGQTIIVDGGYTLN
ncbi:MAG: SDR family oxidoreductase [Clostridia bacterium]|nr:SDR family oxidoreductase [Clostridia bacterium]